MRPITLTFQAFGSYPELVEVDFEALSRRGLFVVTGPTGTGKTTVFDAMAYALFGALPGGRVNDGEVRSHFAYPTTETYVAFTFEVDGERYTIRRTPRYERPKVKGEGTTLAPATATIQRDSDGESLATRVDECSKVAESLIGVNAKQFQRVVLLPQGKFTDFLIATDEDREQLLRQLFGGELYERATKLLKAEMDDLFRQVADIDSQIRFHLRNASTELATVKEAWGDSTDDADSNVDDRSADEISAELDRLEARRSAHGDDVKRLGKQRDVALVALTNAQSAADRFDRAQTLIALIHALELTRDQIAADALLATSSASARPVVGAHVTFTAATTRVEQADAGIEAARVQVSAGFDQLGCEMPKFDSAGVATAVANEAVKVDEQRKILGLASETEAKAIESERQLKDAETERDTAVAAIEELTSRRIDTEARIADLKVAADGVERLTQAVKQAREAAERHARFVGLQSSVDDARVAAAEARNSYEETMRQFILGTAPRLAAELSDGEPCSVCGSLEHPNPAQLVDGDAVDHEQVDAARAVWADADGRLSSFVARLDAERQLLGDLADRGAEHVSAEVSAAEIALAEAEKAFGESTRLSGELARLVADLESATNKRLEAATRAGVLAGEASRDRIEANRLAGVAASIDVALLDTRFTIVTSLRDIADTLDGLFTEHASAVTALSIAKSALESALSTSGFATIDNARQALLDEAIELRFKKAFDDWNTENTRARSALGEVEALGVPGVRPDVEVAREQSELATATADEATRHFNTAVNALTACRAALYDARTVMAGSEELRGRYDTARTVYRTCNGEAGTKIKMERWVLAGELERVAEAANVHLNRMTNHRYTLHRDSESKGGLRLLVSDAHTGRSRATASLSGGEQFQASLSLALGLADVVSRGGVGSGKTFEALFVDEGFGSLDPEALDQAINALAQLHATGRMVGAITHVEEMKQNLHVGIEVRRRTDGRGSTLVVTP